MFLRSTGGKIARSFFVFFFFLCYAALMYAYCFASHPHLQSTYPYEPTTKGSFGGFLTFLGMYLYFMFGICALPFVVVTAFWFGLLFFSSRPERYVAVLVAVVAQFILLALMAELLCNAGNFCLGAGFFGHLLYSLTKTVWVGDLRWLIGGISCLLVFLWYGIYSVLKKIHRLADNGYDEPYQSQPGSLSTLSDELLVWKQDETAVVLQEEKPFDGDMKAYGDHLATPVCQRGITQKNIYTLPVTKKIFTATCTNANKQAGHSELKKRASVLKEKLAKFGIKGDVVAIKPGPLVTLYEYQPHIEVKVSKITSLGDDLTLALQAQSLRIIAPIPGKSRVGFEVANQTRSVVSFGEMVKSATFECTDACLPLILGKNTSGEPVVIDLVKAPHVLVAGSTGSGKSVGLNGMLASILIKKKPCECKLILIDPKRLEFAPYASVPHLLFPVVTDPKEAIKALAWLTREMEQRYEAMAQYRVRNIADYNRMSTKNKSDLLPYIVVVIDELADLMMICSREIEHWITRLTQMARAAGIHVILATQRPSVDVITGLIKVNIPSRVAFRVASKIDSRTILGMGGAEKLLGRGDMLLQLGDGQSLRRVHGAYIGDSELESLIHCVADQASPEYIDLTELSHTPEDLQQTDDLLVEVEVFLESLDEISISLLQRKFRIGFNRSARLIDLLEQKGRILPPTGKKMRKVVK